MSKIINIYYRRWPFSTLTVTSKLPIFKANLAKVTRSCCLQALLFLKVWVIESSFHFCDGSDRFFPRVRVIKNFWRFDVLFDKKRSIIRLYLFFYLLVFSWRAKMTNTSSSSLRSLHIFRKENCRKMKQGKWGNLSYFLFFRIWIWWSVR